GSVTSSTQIGRRLTPAWVRLIRYQNKMDSDMLGVEAINRAGAVRQKAYDRRAGALGVREPKSERGKAQATRLRKPSCRRQLYRRKSTARVKSLRSQASA